jgi:hypothetical protein
VNADFDAHGMNGRIVSDLPNVSIDKSKHGNYSARIGSGGAGLRRRELTGIFASRVVRWKQRPLR